MKKKSKHVYLIFFMMLLFFVSVISTGTLIKAETVPTTEEVYQDPPIGISNLSKIMVSPTEYTTDSNGVRLDTILKNSQSILTQYPSQIIQMTSGGKRQVGSIWGKYKDDNGNDYNIFDLTKPQTISAWLYFGGSNTIRNNDTDATQMMVSDGMAFVLQNDDRKENAISTTNESIGGTPDNTASVGQTLGVWGGQGWSVLVPPWTVELFAKTAIQHSFAMEFDTNNNNVNDQISFNDGLDTLMGVFDSVYGEHIAYNYPGESSAYATFHNNITNLYQLHHNVKQQYMIDNPTKPIENPIINNLTMSGYDESMVDVAHAWHHFTLEYTPPVAGSTQATINYVFDDKDYDGSVRPENHLDDRVNQPLDISKIDPKGTGKAIWGFTSSTGDESDAPPATNAIILQTVPGMATVDASTSLYDETQDRNILDIVLNPKANSTVSDGDSLRFDYDLNYTSGTIDTGDVTANINLPEYVDFKKNKDGNIGKIIYGEGDDQKTVPIPASEITSDNKLSLTIDSISKYNDKIKVQLFGKADIAISDTLVEQDVDEAHTSYTSDYYVGDVMSPAFKINNEVLQLASTSNHDLYPKLNETDGKIALTASYKRGSKFDGNDLTFYTQVDGGDVMSATSPTSATEKSYDYGLEYNASTLGLGKHIIEIYAEDSSGKKSNTLTFNITVEDYKKIVLSSDNTVITSLLSDDTNMAGIASYYDDDGVASDISSADLHWSIDGDEEIQEKLSTKDFTHTIPAGTLAEGDHVVTVYADDGVRKSNTLTYNVKVINGSATLENDSEYEFQTINQDSEMNRIVHRAGTWKLAVESLNSTWSLTAKSDGLINKTTNLPLVGNLIFVSGDTMNSLQNPVLVDEDDTASETPEVKDIAGAWGNDDGILLKVQPSTTEGGYTGTISWTLTASVDE